MLAIWLGTPIYSQVYSDIIVANIGDSIRFNITGVLPLTLNNQYTFEFTINIVNLRFVSSGLYIDGQVWQDGVEIPASDFLFSASILQSGIGLEESLNTNDEVYVFPNPSLDFIQVAGLLESESYVIFNAIGAKLANGIISDGEQIPVGHFKPGMYLMKLENGEDLRFIRQ